MAETAQLTNADDEAIRILIGSPASNAKLKDLASGRNAWSYRLAQASDTARAAPTSGYG